MVVQRCDWGIFVKSAYNKITQTKGKGVKMNSLDDPPHPPISAGQNTGNLTLRSLDKDTPKEEHDSWIYLQVKVISKNIPVCRILTRLDNPPY